MLIYGEKTRGSFGLRLLDQQENFIQYYMAYTGGSRQEAIRSCIEICRCLMLPFNHEKKEIIGDGKGGYVEISFQPFIVRRATGVLQ